MNTVLTVVVRVMTPVTVVVMVMTPVPVYRWANVTAVIRVMTPVTVVMVMTHMPVVVMVMIPVPVVFCLFCFLPSTSLWGVYSETFIHRYSIPLTHAFTRLCMIFSPHMSVPVVVMVMTPVFVCRRASVSSLIRLRAASMHMPSSAGSSFLRRDSTMLRRDSTLHSFMMSEKSRTTLSAKLRSKLQICLLYQNE